MIGCGVTQELLTSQQLNILTGETLGLLFSLNLQHWLATASSQHPTQQMLSHFECLVSHSTLTVYAL